MHAQEHCIERVSYIHSLLANQVLLAKFCRVVDLHNELHCAVVVDVTSDVEPKIVKSTSANSHQLSLYVLKSDCRIWGHKNSPSWTLESIIIII